MRLQVLDLAKNDLVAGYHFYEAKEKGLGVYFLDSLYLDVERLRVTGGTHRKAYRDFHRALSEKFPFAIYYTVEDGVARIRAVVDCRSQPSKIHRHLRSA
jgi:hypothetical protein